MRNILLLLACSILIAGGIVSNAQTSVQAEDAGTPDSTLDVIGYFSKNDTLVYVISQSRWRISPEDTVMTAGVTTKVRLTVTDSTPDGYKMDYTFLEFKGDSVADAGLAGFRNTIVEKLGKKIVGTTVRFETDEFGSITRFNNLGKIKRQAKSLFHAAMDELAALPEIAAMKEYNIDIKALTKDVDTDRLVDGYLEELKLLFLCHGQTFDIGRSHVHEDATDSTYENDTYRAVALDSSDYTYSIRTDVVNYIPRSAIKDMVGGVVRLMDNDSITASFNSGFDAQVTENSVYDSYYSADFLAHGWPYRIVNQTTTTIAGSGKSQQTYIYLDYINY